MSETYRLKVLTTGPGGQHQEHQVEVALDGDTPLLWVIREHLRMEESGSVHTDSRRGRPMTGTKFGCGVAQCGACTVHLLDKDGKSSAIRSCAKKIKDVNGATIRTIECLSAPGCEAKDLHPVQAAWFKHNVPQCGYCQSGQIMSAVALLENDRQPTDKKIDDVMAGNLCRCGTYPRIRNAIKDAAKIR